MTALAFALRAAVFLLLASAGSAHAQALPTGIWTGTMVPPEGREVPVTYEVTRTGGELGITMTAGDSGARPLEDIRVDGDRLHFTFQMGARLSCDLQRMSDGAYSGTCSTGGAQSGELTMRPPPGSG